jgi:starch phosphorylase
MATLQLPAWGYGIRYQYGMFRQTLVDGFQHEQPDYWLTFGNPWEIERPVVTYNINYYGHVSVSEEGGKQSWKWNPGEEMVAVAYDNPIPGFDTAHTINLRLWSAKPQRQFDLEAFNTGDYVQAILARQRAETISSVLYPDDRTYEGKELRLKQQFFFSSASLQDVVRRYRETHDSMDQFPDKVAFQLNDTHPVIAIPELMRLLMDECQLGWTQSWEITQKVFAYTNHTVMPEALEKWPVNMLEKVLPRHMQIIYDINWRFIQKVKEMPGGQSIDISKISIIEEDGQGSKRVRMANLACVTAHTINGVAAIHSEIVKNHVFNDFYRLFPEKFQNKTNGVTQRRWLAFCNPRLRDLITEKLGTQEWIKDLNQLRGIEKYADDAEFQNQWLNVKLERKQRLAETILRLTGIEVNPESMFDVHVKRIHEYKRQLMNILSIIHRYYEIKKMSPEARSKVVPRVCIFGGKAAPGYDMAKRIIKLVTVVGEKVNNDPDIGDLLKVVFLPDYNVSLAEQIIPAADLSQHISTAGTEASGTSNMKFAMNGSLIIGTLDGANVEIAEEIGIDNMFIFGHKTNEIDGIRKARATFRPDQRFTDVLDHLRGGDFGWQDYFAPLTDSVSGDKGGDYYLVANDFPKYLDAQAEVDKAYMDKKKWAKMSILSVGGTGKFSSDRTIDEYAKDIWKIQKIVAPTEVENVESGHQ